MTETQQQPHWVPGPEHETAVSTWATAEVLPVITSALKEKANELAREWEVDPYLVSAFLAKRLAESMHVLADWRAGEARAHGSTMTEIGKAVGISQRSNVRRDMPSMGAFEAGRREANSTRRPVDVVSGEWTVTLEPDPF